jgi:hypothetical protein
VTAPLAGLQPAPGLQVLLIQAMNSVRKGDALLQRLVNDKALSQTGMEWLRVAIDPFHDTQVECHGFPDVRQGASVIRPIKQQLTIAAPAGTTAPWDCHIFNFPEIGGRTMASYLNTSNSISYSSLVTPPTYFINGLHYVSVTTGEPTSPNWVSLLPQAQGGLNVSDPYIGPYDAHRVVAQGFEVTNTTAAINLQGAVTVYRQPQEEFEASGVYTCVDTLDTNENTALGVYDVTAPPTLLSQATLLSGSRTWAAAEGCYVVPTLNRTNLQTRMPDVITPAVRGWLVNTLFTGALQTSDGLLADATSSLAADFNISGAYFTGLSPTTTLQVAWTVYLETFPSAIDPHGVNPLTTLAKPCARYDPAAVELYSHCMHAMPVGVMVKENGLGDWFKSAISGVAKYAAPALSLIPHPLAQAASTGLGAVGKVMKAYQDAKRPEAMDQVREDRRLIKQRRKDRRRAQRQAKVKQLAAQSKGQ